MPEIDKETLDKMVADVAPEKRDAFLQDFKARGFTVKGAAPGGESLLNKAAGVATEHALPTAGWMYGAETGAEMGAPLGPWGAAAGAVGGAYLGGAAGRALTEGAKAVTPGAPKESLGTAMQKTAQEGKESAVGEATGRPLGAVAGKAWDKMIAMAPEARAATDKAIATAKSMGFKMMPSQETDNYLAGLFESAMRKLSGGARVIQQFEQAQNAGYAAAKNKILDSLGKETEMEFGGSLKEALGKSNDALTARANALLQKGQINKDAYDAALARHEQKLAQIASDSLKSGRQGIAAGIGGAPTAEGRGVAVQLERAHQAALDHLQQQAHWSKALSGVPGELDRSLGSNLTATSAALVKRLEGAGIKNEVYASAKRNLASQEDEEVAGILSKAAASGLIDAPGAAGQTTYTLKALQDKQSFYGDLAERHRNPSTGAFDKFGDMYRQLQAAARADMDTIFAQPGVPAQARQDWQIAKAFTKEKAGMADLQVVKRLWNENPSAVLDSVVKAGDRKGTQTLIQALGGGEAGKTQVRRHVFDTVFGSGDEPIPSRDKIMARLSEYSDNLAVLFSKDEQKQLYALGEKAETPKFIQDRYDRRVKEILANNKQQALLQRDPTLRRLARQEPHQLVQAVLSGDTNVVRAIKKYVPPEQFEAYQRYGMRDLLADPALPRTGTAHLKEELGRKPEFYKELLGEKNWAQMQHIGDAELLLPGFKDRKGGVYNGTQLGMAATFGVLGLVIHPFSPNWGNRALAVGAGLTILPQALTSLYLSDAGRRVVTTLLRLPQSDPRTTYLIGRLAAAGYITSTGAQQPQQGAAGAP